MNTLVKSFRPVSAYPFLLNNIFGEEGLNGGVKKSQDIPAANILEEVNFFKIELAVPGAKKEDFKINVDGKHLSISRTIEESKEVEESNYTRKEFSQSSFERKFFLPKSVDVDGIGASYENGILTLSLPKKEEAKEKEARLITVS